MKTIRPDKAGEELDNSYPKFSATYENARKKIEYLNMLKPHFDDHKIKRREDRIRYEVEKALDKKRFEQRI